MSEFAPPTSGIYPGQEGAAAVEPLAAADDGKPLTAQQRLAALKAKLSEARKTNHSAVVEEDRRAKLGPAGLKEEAKQKRYDQLAKDGKHETEVQKMMSLHCWLQQLTSKGPGLLPALAPWSDHPVKPPGNLGTTAATAQQEQEKLDKKARRRGEYGWDVFNNEAQHGTFVTCGISGAA